MPGSLIPVWSGRLRSQAKPKSARPVGKAKSRPVVKTCRLLRLPDELLVEIFKELSWRDTLWTRQTCSRLRDVSKSLSIWRTFARREPRQALWLELPVEAYNAEELERLILRRKSADVHYEKATDCLNLEQRTLPIKMDFPHGSSYLVPGGRWLLIATKLGSVNYYDLNSEDFIGRELIPERFNRCRTSMYIDLDPDSPTLAFNLALKLLDTAQRFPDYQETFEVWKVHLIIGEQGKGVALTARSMTQFLQEPRGVIQSMSFIGDNIAYVMRIPPHDRTYAFIVNWKTIQRTKYTKRVVRHTSSSACCLLDGYICIADGRRLHLYSLTSIPNIVSLPLDPGQIPHSQPLTTVTLPGVPQLFAVSYPALFHGQTHFVVEADDAIYEIVMKAYGVTPTLEAIRLPDVPMLLAGRPSISDDFCLVWTDRYDLFLQRFPAPAIRKPSEDELILLSRIPCETPCHLLDMASGQILVYDSSRNFRILYLRSL